MKYVIKDWAGNRKFPDQVFDTYEDGWQFLYVQFPDDPEENGVLQDFYVVPLEEA